MENITVKNIARKENVIQIGSNPRFENTKLIPLPKSLDRSQIYNIFVMQHNAFGFACGDELISRPEFDVKQLKPDTLVISESESGIQLTTFANSSRILSVVVAFVREVKDA